MKIKCPRCGGTVSARAPKMNAYLASHLEACPGVARSPGSIKTSPGVARSPGSIKTKNDVLAALGSAFRIPEGDDDE